MKKLVSKIINSISHRYLPRRFKLYGIYTAYLLNDPETELLQVKHLAKTRRTAIDIGANLGLWTYELSRHFERVIAFEINDEISKFIEDFNHSRVTLYKNGLSNRETEISYFVPLEKNGFKNHGWATVQIDRRDKLFIKFEEKKGMVKTLDSYKISNVDLIKIDVEGHELNVIEGALETISNNKPLIIVESNLVNLKIILEWLSPLGYKNKDNENTSEGNFILWI